MFCTNCGSPLQGEPFCTNCGHAAEPPAPDAPATSPEPTAPDAPATSPEPTAPDTPAPPTGAFDAGLLTHETPGTIVDPYEPGELAETVEPDATTGDTAHDNTPAGTTAAAGPFAADGPTLPGPPDATRQFGAPPPPAGFQQPPPSTPPPSAPPPPPQAAPMPPPTPVISELDDEPEHSRRGLAWVVIAATVIIVLIIAGTVWYLVDRQGHDTADDNTPPLPATATTTTPTTAATTPDSTAATTPTVGAAPLSVPALETSETPGVPVAGTGTESGSTGDAADGAPSVVTLTVTETPSTSASLPSGDATPSGAASNGPTDTTSTQAPPSNPGQTYTAPGGLSIQAPPGWTPDTSVSGSDLIDYVEPGAASRLSGGHFRVGITSRTSPTDLKSEAEAAAAYVRSTFDTDQVTGPTYHDFLGTTAADIEYAYYNASTGAQRHNIERLWHYDGHTYMIESAGRGDQWDQTRAVFQMIIDTAQMD